MFRFPSWSNLRKPGRLISAARLELHFEHLEDRIALATTTAITNGSWLDPGIWDNGVPSRGDDVVIPAGRAVQLDGSAHDAKTLLVNGTLAAVENGVTHKTLVSDWILVDGGVLRVGTEADRYDTNTLTITLEGDDPLASFPSVGVATNNAFLMSRSGGEIHLHGKEKVSWTQLGTTAASGAAGIMLKEPIDWDVGDQIVIASTSFDMDEAEVRTITKVLPGSMSVRINQPLAKQHYGELQTYDRGDGTIYTLDERAEVGLLSRNIKIQGDASGAGTEVGTILAVEDSGFEEGGTTTSPLGQGPHAPWIVDSFLPGDNGYAAAPVGHPTANGLVPPEGNVMAFTRSQPKSTVDPDGTPIVIRNITQHLAQATTYALQVDATSLNLGSGNGYFLELGYQDGSSSDAANFVAIAILEGIWSNRGTFDELTVMASLSDGDDAIGNPLAIRWTNKAENVGGGPNNAYIDNVRLSEGSIISDGIGGHLMFMPGSGVVHIDGVELYHMGQKSQLARYPVHWHLAGDRAGDYVKNTSIHHSFNRVVTIHASHNILVERTVAYDHIGSGYFLENAVETGNKFYYNLGLVTREPQPGEELLPTDLGPKQLQISGPGTFWITNPDNEFVGNVAGGSQAGSGFWVALPTGPLNQSMDDPQYAGVNPQTTALKLFQGNRAHSNAIGLDIDGGPDVNTDEAISAHYNPPTIADFTDLTAFANTKNGIYIRGTGNIHVTNALLANNYQGTMFAFDQMISDSLIVGVTDNAIAGAKKHGFAVYDGPNTVRNVHFAGFNNAGAGLFTVIGASSRHANHIFEDITISDPATPFTFPDSLKNNTLSRHWGFSLYDTDGTLTGTTGQSIIYDHPMMRSDGDIVLPGWEKAAVSQRRFGHLKLIHGLAPANQPTTTISRTGGPGTDASHTDIPEHEAYTQIGLVMNTDFVYTVNYDTPLNSNKIDVNVIDTISSGDYVFVRVKHPWAGVNVANATMMTSEQGVRNATVDAYHVDPCGYVFIKNVGNGTVKMTEGPPLPGPDEPVLPGDFSGDNVVDAADYTIWRDTLGSTGDLRADHDQNCQIDNDDYQVWVAHFGQTIGSAAASTFEEIPPAIVDQAIAQVESSHDVVPMREPDPVDSIPMKIAFLDIAFLDIAFLDIAFLDIALSQLGSSRMLVPATEPLSLESTTTNATSGVENLLFLLASGDNTNHQELDKEVFAADRHDDNQGNQFEWDSYRGLSGDLLGERVTLRW